MRGFHSLSYIILLPSYIWLYIWCVWCQKASALPPLCLARVPLLLSLLLSLTSKRLPYTLVPHADAEEGKDGPQLCNRLQGDAGLGGLAWKQVRGTHACRHVNYVWLPW